MIEKQQKKKREGKLLYIGLFIFRDEKKVKFHSFYSLAIDCPLASSAEQKSNNVQYN